MRDRDYQYELEDKIMANGYNYSDLWRSISYYFSSDDMIDFLEYFADIHDIELDED